MSCGEPSARAGERRADRVALLRHRRGPPSRRLPPPRRPRSAQAARGRGRSSRRHRLRWQARRRAPRRASGSCATGASAPEGRARVRRASSSATPPSPKPASVPAAPPSCAASRSRETCSSRARASTTAVSQPAALRPNVVGTACCRSVRATIGVSRCSRASAAAAAATRSASASTSASARRETSIAAVSTMSWLVAPRCTYARRVLADRAGEGAHERLDGIADGAALLQELLEVEAVGVAGAGDLGREVCRNRAGGRAGVRERTLCVEQRFEPGPGRHGGPEVGGDEKAVERRHAAIVVVHGRIPRVNAASRLLEQRRGYSTCGAIYNTQWSSEGRSRAARWSLSGTSCLARTAVGSRRLPVAVAIRSRRRSCSGSWSARRADLGRPTCPR